MRHTAYLLMGEELTKLAPQLKQYTLMYGASTAVDYLQVLSCSKNEDTYDFCSYVLDRPEEETVFSSGFGNKYRIGTAFKDNLTSEAQVQQYIIDLFNRTVTIEDPGETGILNICICLPLYSLEYWQATQSVLDEIHKSGKPVKIDVIGFPASMSLLICSDENAKARMIELSIEHKSIAKSVAREIVGDTRIHRLIIFEDNNSKRISLNLDTDGLVRILAEYAMLCVEHYPCLFPVNQIGSKIDVTSFGLSMLAFDKIYFIDYLLHSAYLEILGKEKVTQSSVNINQAAEWASQQLNKHINLYSIFFKTRVEPLLNERNKSGDLSDADIQLLDVELQESLNKAVDEMQSFIKDESRSLPEKQAIMALLLGEDDPLLEGQLYQKGQVTIDDCDKETLELYIGEDNKCVEVIVDPETNKKKVKRGVLTAPVDEFEHVYLPLEQMKLLRAQIRQRTSYIRKKTEELGAIQDQVQDVVETTKKIDGGGFSFDGKVYKLMPKDKEIRLFEKFYTPKSNSERSVDLRSNFTVIKNQGSLGACSAFSIVSIFEQIMKKSNPSNPDLSERFAYYNALRLANPSAEELSDEGSTFFDVVSALTTQGLCTEELCPYKEEIEKPSEEAYSDGPSRLVKEAMNVEVSHESLTSALAEGYPVAISLKIYDSFEPGKNGFVFRPKDGEINASEGGNHAMVLCGYSEDDKVYIVRNSWGTKFGDKGYCYIPFSYVDDPQLNNQACIITDVEVTEMVHIAGVEKKKTVSFNLTDDNIRASILRILIGEEEIHLQKDTKKYADLRYKYEQLLQTLSNPSKRDEIYEHSVERIDKTLEDANNQYNEFVNKTRPEAIDNYKKESLSLIIILGGVCLFCILVSGIFFYFELFKVGTVIGVIAGILAILIFFYWMNRKHNIEMLKKEMGDKASQLNLEIAHLKKEMNEKHLRMHLAGRVISSLTDIKLDLINKYQSLTGYVSGLNKWCEEEQSKLNSMVPPAKTPCIQMLNNQILDRYFEKSKDEITNGFHLYDLVDSFKLTDEDILNFKLKIRDMLIAKLKDEYEDFSMISYLTNKQKYPYLPESSEISAVMATIDKRSDCFIRISQTDVPIGASLEKSIFIHTETQAERNDWRNLYCTYYSVQPGDEDLNSKYKLIELQIQNLKLDQVSILNDDN